MNNLEDFADDLASHILTSMQASIMMNHMALAKLLDEGIVSNIDTMSEDEKYIVMAARPCGKLIIAVMFDDLHKVYLLEAMVDSESSTLDKLIYVAQVPDNEDTKVIWEGLLDDIYEWAEGKIDKIEIGY
jgi:hypothetical protein